jgi:tRNA threonylcarbamoyl adenosine modification protein (Sua5/YciO/YrdC/YwlC family)
MNVYTTIDDPEIIDRLLQGQVGILPTDSVYGLVCLANLPASVARLYRLKQRENKPGTLIGASINQFVNLGLSEQLLNKARGYWPGPVSVIIPCDIELEYLHLGKDSLAVRIPADPTLQSLLRQTGVLQTSSANLTSQPHANNLAEAQAYFGNKIDFYVDGGDLSNRQPTTVIRIDDSGIEVLRQGAQQVVS